MSVRWTVRAPLRPTEDAAKVEAAVRSLFPPVSLAVAPREVHAEGTDLALFAEAIRKQMIPDAVRGLMFRGRDASGAATTFLLGKQAATLGKIALVTEREGPLGDIHARLEADSPEELEDALRRLAPDTRSPDYAAATGWNPALQRFEPGRKGRMPEAGAAPDPRRRRTKVKRQEIHAEERMVERGEAGDDEVP